MDIYSYEPVLYRKYMESMYNSFGHFFSDKGYLEYESQPVTSKIDKSVRFIGSITSIFKPKYYEEELLKCKYFIKQDCLKTRPLNKNDIKRSSYYSCFGMHVPIVSLDATVRDTYQYLIDCLKIPVDSLETHVSSKHLDLINALSNTALPLKIKTDELSQNRYLHKLGIEEFKGRNLVIFLHNPRSKLKREFISTIVVIGTERHDWYCEITIKPVSVIKYVNNIITDLDCYPFLLTPTIETDELLRFQDCLLVCTLLFRCGLLPTSLDNQTRLFRKYVKQLLNISHNSGIYLNEIEALIIAYEGAHFGTCLIEKDNVTQSLATIIKLTD